MTAAAAVATVKASAEANDNGLVLTRINGQAVAIPTSLVLRTIIIDSLAIVPQTHPALLGLTSAFGAALPIIDGRWLLGDEPSTPRQAWTSARIPALLLLTEHGRLALRIDDYHSTVVYPGRSASTRPSGLAGAAPLIISGLQPDTDALLIEDEACHRRLDQLRNFSKPSLSPQLSFKATVSTP